MKKTVSVICMALVAGAMFTSCGSSNSAAKENKNAIVLQEGDRATLTVDENYTTIVFPDALTSEDMSIYGTDFMGYILNSNGPITTDGGSWDSYRIYYYLHNSKEWLHQGTFANPQEMQVAKIKQIRIANRRHRLREFVDEMPLKRDSKEMKNDQGFQDEISFGNTYYIFVDILLRD